MQPVVNRHVPLRLMSTFVWIDLDHTGWAYSAVEKHKVCVVVLNTERLAPHLLLASFCRILFLAVSFWHIFFAMVPICQRSIEHHAQVSWFVGMFQCGTIPRDVKFTISLPGSKIEGADLFLGWVWFERVVFVVL